MEELLEPIDSLVTLTRNGTALSRYCEGIVKTFYKAGAEAARLRHEAAEYDFDDLYDGTRRVCKKNDYRGIVEVHKQDGQIILIRRKK